MEIGVALVLLVCAIVVVAWVAGKIYRVGILSTGKRPTLAELGRWVWQSS
jgi:ABC-2 type transport system permease protein